MTLFKSTNHVGDLSKPNDKNYVLKKHAHNTMTNAKTMTKSPPNSYFVMEIFNFPLFLLEKIFNKFNKQKNTQKILLTHF
jgi:hypothetical protein